MIIRLHLPFPRHIKTSFIELDTKNARHVGHVWRLALTLFLEKLFYSGIATFILTMQTPAKVARNVFGIVPVRLSVIGLLL